MQRPEEQTVCWDLSWDLIRAVVPGARRHKVVLRPVNEAVVWGYCDGLGRAIIPGGLYPVAFVLLNL